MRTRRNGIAPALFVLAIAWPPPNRAEAVVGIAPGARAAAVSINVVQPVQ
jgi:hypothetical protein